MRSRLRTAIVALGLVGSLGFPPGAEAAYYTACAGSFNNFHSYLDLAVPGGISDAKATVTTWRSVHQCTGSLGGSWVLPVNLQGNGYCALQIGWGRTYGDTTDKWGYTASPSACVMSVPTGWPTPVDTRSYSFRIDHFPCAGGDAEAWRYTLTDNATGTNYYACGQGVPGKLPIEIWAGFEAYRSQDQLGGAGLSNKIKIQDIAYRNGGGAYSNLWSSTVYECCGTDQSYWIEGSGVSGGAAYITQYTTNH